MRLSKLFSPPQKEEVKKEESISAKLLTQAGFINKLSSGLYNLLPMGFLVFKNIEEIIREEFEKAGAQEFLSPIIHPGDLWEKTDRLKSFGPELADFKTRSGRQMVIAPTHEETAAKLGKRYINSYRDLPVIINQIQTKFRDEPRTRGGLLRAKEFVMQDAYSFDKDREGLEKSYEKIKEVYKNIFDRLDLSYLIVESDVGAMGGYFGEEFMLESRAGEDTLIVCSECNYRANIEAAGFKREKREEKEKKLKKVKTPQKKTIEELSDYLNISPDKMAKMVFYENREKRKDDGKDAEKKKEAEKNKKVTAVIIRGDLDINQTKLAKVLGTNQFKIADKKRVKETGAVPGYANPIGIDARVIVYPSIKKSSNLLIGANEKGFHLKNFNLERDFKKKAEIKDVAEAKRSLACFECGGKLKEKQAIELGHVFQLGKKYSEAFDVSYLNKKGEEKICEMGSYGIGLGRLMAAVVEDKHDKQGIIWPENIAPFKYHLISLGDDKEVKKEAERVYKHLKKENKKVLFDDRDRSSGVKFNDVDLMGIPIRLIVSKKTVEKGKVEKSKRDSDKKELVEMSEL